MKNLFMKTGIGKMKMMNIITTMMMMVTMKSTGMKDSMMKMENSGNGRTYYISMKTEKFTLMMGNMVSMTILMKTTMNFYLKSILVKVIAKLE